MNISLTRRSLLGRGAGALCAAAGLVSAGHSAAADYPRRPIRIVVGYPPGQTVDVTARAYANVLQQSLGQAVFVDNKPGANGILGAQTVKAAEADGHTLLFGTSGQLAINPAIYDKLAYATLADFAPVAMGAVGRLYLVANKALPVADLQQLIAYAKANPGKLSYGSGGAGITAHLAMEILKSATGMDALHVPYKGSPAALNGLLGGDVQLMFDAGALVLPQIQAGKIKALAVSSKERFAALPQVPTVAEQGFRHFEVATWSAMVAPAATPAAVVEQLNAAMQAAARDPSVVATVRAAGSEPRPISTAQFNQFLRSELTLWAGAASRAGVKAE